MREKIKYSKLYTSEWYELGSLALQLEKIIIIHLYIGHTNV